MSNPSINTLLRSEATPAAPHSERNARDGVGATEDDFARALERRMGNAPDRVTQAATQVPAPKASPRPPAPAKSPDKERKGAREAESATEPVAARTASQTLRTQAEDLVASQAAAPAAPTTKPATEPTTQPTTQPTTEPTAAPDVQGTTEIAAAATELPAETTLAANLAALLQGIGILPPAAPATVQPSTALTADASPDALLGGGEGGSTRILSNVLATLQRDGLPQVGMPANTKGDGPATATTEAPADFAVPTRELAAPAAARAQQNPELLRSTAPAVAAEPAAVATATPASQLVAPPDGQALGLQFAGLAPTQRSEAAHAAQLPVHTPAGQAAWADDVGNRVIWMTGRNESKAELVLTPAHLGKLEISIQVSGDQTTAQFVAATAAARDALEQALPRLRDVLQQAGINLGQTNVSTSSDQRAQRDDRAAAGNGNGGSGRSDAAVDEIRPAGPAAVWSRAALGMVDTFA